MSVSCNANPVSLPISPLVPHSILTLSASTFFIRAPCNSTGDEIVVVVQKARPISNAPGQANTQKVRRGDVRHAVIVRTKKEMTRPDGRVIRFDDNACVLLNNKKEPLGTRVNGVVANELRAAGWGKIASLAPKVI